MKKKIIIVDPKVYYRHFLKNFLLKAGDAEVILEISTEKEFVEGIKKHKADIAFVNLKSPGTSCIEATKMALKTNPDLTVIGMALLNDKVMFDKFIKAGAKDYFLKTSINTEVIKQILRKNYNGKNTHAENNNKTEKSQRKKTAVVVDDFETNVFVTSSALSIAGYNVLKATSGIKALTFFDGRDIDLLLTDFKMPGMTGAELIQRIRQKSKYNKTPAIVISSEKGEKEKQLARQAGISAWLQKPFDIERFIKIIKTVL